MNINKKGFSMKYSDLDIVKNSYGTFFTKESVVKLLMYITSEPSLASECSSNRLCFFCGNIIDYEEHENDCIYIEIRKEEDTVVEKE